MRPLLTLILTLLLTGWNAQCFGQGVKKPEIKVDSPQVLDQRASKPADQKARTSLQDEVRAIGAREASLRLPSGIYDITGNFTVPSNIHLIFEKGAMANIASGVTLTLDCTLEAGPYQIFKWAGTGKVLFKRAVAGEMPLRWWGAKGDAVTDDTAAIQKAFNTVDAAAWPGIPGRIIGIPTDTYLVETITFAPCAQNRWELYGNGATLKQKSTKTILELKHGTTVAAWKFLGSNKVSYAGSGIKTSYGGGHIYDCFFKYLDKGIEGIYAIYGVFENLEMEFVGNGGKWGDHYTLSKTCRGES